MSMHYDVLVVVGGGQSGLAIGHHLARQDRSFRILEAAGTPAAAWRLARSRCAMATRRVKLQHNENSA